MIFVQVSLFREDREDRDRDISPKKILLLTMPTFGSGLWRKHACRFLDSKTSQTSLFALPSRAGHYIMSDSYKVMRVRADHYIPRIVTIHILLGPR
jgi:hypothetical protein